MHLVHFDSVVHFSRFFGQSIGTAPTIVTSRKKKSRMQDDMTSIHNSVLAALLKLFPIFKVSVCNDTLC